MRNQTFHVVGTIALLAVPFAAQSQQPQSQPLADAQQILNSSRAPSAAGLAVGYLQESKLFNPGLWKGFSVQADSKLPVTIDFKDDGSVSSVTPDGRVGRGTWVQKDDSVEITWSTGARVVWRLQNNRLGGEGTTSKGLPWSVWLELQ